MSIRHQIWSWQNTRREVVKISYMEEVFQRAERHFTSLQAQIGWLASFDQRGGNAYEKEAVLAAEQLQNALDIQKATDSASSSELIKLRSEAQSISIVKVRNRTLEDIRDREESLLKQKGSLETLYRNKIKSADTIDELEVIASEFEDELDSKQVNRLKENIAQKKKDIRRAEHEERMKAQEEAAIERKKREKAEREAKRDAELKAEEERKEEARRIQREGQARKEAEREAERELQRAIEREERKIAEQIARGEL